MSTGVQSERERRFALQALTPTEAATEIFGIKGPETSSDDFYPILIRVPSDDPNDKAKLHAYKAVALDALEAHAQIVASATERTYIILASFKREAKLVGGKFPFSFKQKYARYIHGFAIDFDCGREEGSEDAKLLGSTLTQDQVWEGVCQLVEQQLLPPFALWVKGYRGCYGIILFEGPMDTGFAKDQWKYLRTFYHQRAKHLAADPHFLAVTQPLQAPAAHEGRVQYFRVHDAVTGQPIARAVPIELEAFFGNHEHESDLYLSEMTDRRLTVEQSGRYFQAWREFDTYKQKRSPHPSARRKEQSHKNFCKARIDDIEKIVGDSRPKYHRHSVILHYAQASKMYEYAIHQDEVLAYKVTMDRCRELNTRFKKPLSEDRLKAAVREANPTFNLTQSWKLCQQFGITELIAWELDLRSIAPQSVKNERMIRKLEEKASKAEERHRIREQRKKKRQAEARKKAEARQVKEVKVTKDKQRTREKKNETAARNKQVRNILMEGKPTSIIEKAAGVSRKQIGRVKARILAAGITLPQQGRIKPSGRPKKDVTS